MASMEKKKWRRMTLWICLTGILMGANVAMSSFSISVPGGHFYLNDVVICTAAILLDPPAAFMVGGVGAMIGDALFYPAPMFISLVSHGLEAVAISLATRYLFPRRQWLGSLIGVAIGSVLMVTGYSLGRAFVYATPAYAVIKLPFECLQMGVGAASGMLLCYRCGLKRRFERMLPTLADRRTHSHAGAAGETTAEEKND